VFNKGESCGKTTLQVEETANANSLKSGIKLRLEETAENPGQCD
jgi:hypothetical protein